MKTEEIIDRLRNPQKYAKQTASTAQKEITAASSVHYRKHTFGNLIALGIAIFVIGAILITWMLVLRAKSRAENLTASLDPKQIQGLTQPNTEFNPNKEVTYIQITEGGDRNVVVEQLGTTLPIISRYNYQAITSKNYGIIGMAPWALTENFAANLQDPNLMLYLLNRKEVGEAFVSRADVAPLLEDPQLLAAFAQDNETLDNFFNSDTVQQVLANEKMVLSIGGSRFMSALLTSKSAKYYRNHPQEAAKLIEASPALSALRKNAAVRKAVQANYYLKNIAPQLLKTPVSTTRKK